MAKQGETPCLDIWFLIAFAITIGQGHQSPILSTSLLVTAHHSEPYWKMGRMQVLYSFSLVEMKIPDFQIWLSRFWRWLICWYFNKGLETFTDMLQNRHNATPRSHQSSLRRLYSISSLRLSTSDIYTPAAVSLTTVTAFLLAIQKKYQKNVNAHNVCQLAELEATPSSLF